MNAPLPLEGYNATIQPDCILDHPTALSAVYIALFCALTGYMYKASASHWRTFANTAINIVFATCARFLQGRAFVFHWTLCVASDRRIPDYMMLALLSMT